MGMAANHFQCVLWMFLHDLDQSFSDCDTGKMRRPFIDFGTTFVPASANGGECAQKLRVCSLSFFEHALQEVRGFGGQGDEAAGEFSFGIADQVRDVSVIIEIDLGAHEIPGASVTPGTMADQSGLLTQ